MTTPLSSISGLISGIDTSSLIDAIIAQARQPAVQMESKETDISNQQAALTSYQALMTALQTSVSAMADGTAFTATQASTSVLAGSSPLATVTSTSDATPASYTLQVTQLAAAAKLGSGSQASATTPLNLSGSFTIQGQTVTLSASDTLSTLRDKINALNSGTTPLNVTASILSVSPTDNRLILTSNTSGSAGIALADTAGGTALQSLGLLNATEAIPASAVLVQGADANFSLDGIALVRSSNTVSDAIAGVTLTLTQADPTNVAKTSISVGRDSSAATTTIQNFVTAYNAVVSFVQAQGTVTQNSDGTTTTPPLYGDSMIRDVRSQLPATLLQSVFGAAADMTTVASVGISLGSDGKLTFDSTKFATAFSTRYNDLTALFDEQLSSSNSALTAVSSGNGASGTYDVNITAPATYATLSTTGFSGTYDDGGTPDVVTLTDTQNGKSADVTLSSGMTTAQIVTAMQTAATAAGLAINVSANGNDVVFTHQNAGSAAGISITATGTDDGTGAVWGIPATSHGTDVQGTIGGFVATGSGSILVANTGSPLAGVTVRYAGSDTGDVGSVTISEGAAASLNNFLANYLDTASGQFDQRNAALVTQNDSLVSRVADIDARLALQRASLVSQYAAMEAAIASLKQGASSLLGSLGGTTGSDTTSSSSS
ncbi:MAG TPA: flagellar filament capping protein FliD [Gemmatimonadales bacterium]|jgi:flagellar hook-associated protein 2